MNRYDWQAYVADALSPEEKARHESRLALDPIARREVDGLATLVREVRKAVMSEPVPKSNLLSGLKRATASRLALPMRIALAASVALAVLVGAWVFNQGDPVQLDRSPVADTFVTTSPVVAAQWVAEQTGLPAPVMRTKCGAKIKAAKYGQGWAGYQFEQDGRRYRLFMSRCSKPFDGARVITREGREFYVGKGIGWKQNGIAYYLRGGDEDNRWRLAHECVSSIREHKDKTDSGV